MAKVFDGYLDLFTLVYLDNILIFSDNLEDHYNHVKLVIERLRKHNLKVKLSKCKFAQTRIEYLSHIIEDRKISPNPAKVAALANATRPKTVKQIQSFLGLVSYYRKFIKNC
jgi:putative transposase